VGRAGVGGGAAFFEQLAHKLSARSRVVLDAPALRPSAVLVPLIEGAEPRLLLTRKPEKMRSHAGQVAFPGGASDPDDADALATALREAEEELGIPPASVTPLGMLDDGWVITGYRVTPWVGRIPADLVYRPNPLEVAHVFEVPVDALMDPARTKLRIERVVRDDATFDIPYFEHGGEVIWGATGRIVLQLLEVAFGFLPPEPLLPKPAP
jgi:8-oxo-dGTP pyrophosphatase MutT (NUDIX family)